MSSEEIEVDLPVAAEVHTVADGVLNEQDLHSVLKDESMVEESDEFVKRQDAEEAIKKARQAVKQLIKDKRQEFNNGRDSEYPQKVLTELLEEVDQS